MLQMLMNEKFIELLYIDSTSILCISVSNVTLDKLIKTLIKTAQNLMNAKFSRLLFLFSRKLKLIICFIFWKNIQYESSLIYKYINPLMSIKCSSFEKTSSLDNYYFL